MTLEILGTAEAAKMLGVEPQRLSKWRKNGVLLPSGRRVEFPKPMAELRATPVWLASDIRVLRDWLSEPRQQREVESFSEHVASRAA